MIATAHKYILNFKRPGGTSRGILNTKETWFIKIKSERCIGIGECAIFRGLSIDDRPEYEDKLNWVCKNIDLGLKVLLDELFDFPSIQFGLDMAFRSYGSSDPYLLFPSNFTEGNDSIAINGLIWMGDRNYMKQQIKDKIQSGFKCLKLKIGAINFDEEVGLLKAIRKEFSSDDIELRVDANGAFAPYEALEKLKVLSEFDLHSIEQPIKQGQWQEMARLCDNSLLPIALDEELIGVFTVTEKQKLLQTIKPQFIILKPSLVGGFLGSDEWINLAEKQKLGWWITSALESNIGLNAIAQYTYTRQNLMPQGLGTGELFTNNFDCPLQVKNGKLHHINQKNWKVRI